MKSLELRLCKEEKMKKKLMNERAIKKGKTKRKKEFKSRAINCGGIKDVA
jgi:hypothetical protein